MHLEIERRFLASPAALSYCGVGTKIEQGYLRADGRMTVRIRIANDTAVLTIKGRRHGCCRLEHEIPIALETAKILLGRVPQHMKIQKTRYMVEVDAMVWEVDVFSGRNAGLILAEIEFDHPERLISLPHWVIGEVTDDPIYSNSQLARRPYSLWDMAA